jgi:hypothetical protein
MRRFPKHIQEKDAKYRVSTNKKRREIRAFEIYSHSIVAGGFDEMSYTTRLTPLT